MSDGQAGVAGESVSAPFRVGFDRRLELQFHGTKQSSDGGFIVFGELGEAIGLTRKAWWPLRDIRTGNNSCHNPARYVPAISLWPPGGI
jgi:hypothetical protein